VTNIDGRHLADQGRPTGNDARWSKRYPALPSFEVLWHWAQGFTGKAYRQAVLAIEIGLHLQSTDGRYMLLLAASCTTKVDDEHVRLLPHEI
jgi:hypothetical protein